MRKLIKTRIKLIFEFAGDESGERMWVEVTGKKDGYYMGSLSNHPVGEKPDLFRGAELIFEPRHVTQTEPPEVSNEMYYNIFGVHLGEVVEILDKGKFSREPRTALKVGREDMGITESSSHSTRHPNPTRLLKMEMER